MKTKNRLGDLRVLVVVGLDLILELVEDRLVVFLDDGFVGAFAVDTAHADTTRAAGTSEIISHSAAIAKLQRTSTCTTAPRPDIPPPVRDA